MKYKIEYKHFFRGVWEDGEYTDAGEGLTWDQTKILHYKLSKDKDFKDVLIKPLKGE